MFSCYHLVMLAWPLRPQILHRNYCEGERQLPCIGHFLVEKSLRLTLGDGVNALAVFSLKFCCFININNSRSYIIIKTKFLIRKSLSSVVRADAGKVNKWLFLLSSPVKWTFEFGFCSPRSAIDSWDVNMLRTDPQMYGGPIEEEI